MTSSTMYVLRWLLLFCLWWNAERLCAQTSDSTATTVAARGAGTRHQRAKALLRLAEEHIRDGNPAAARSLLNQAITLQHDLSDAYFLRAELKRAENDLVGAIVDYSVVIHLQPEHREARFQRALSRYEAQRYAAAREDFQTLLNQESGETNVVYFKGSVEHGAFVASAATTMQSDIKSDLLNHIGLCYWHTQHFVLAEEYFSRAIAHAPQEPAAYVNQGLTHEASGDTLRAVSLYRQALRIAPDHPVALRNLASLARQLEDTTLEEEILFNDRPDSYDAWLQRGMYQHRQKDYPEAIRSFTEALQVSLYSAEVLIQRGFSYEKIRAFEEALEDYSTAIRLDPRATKAYSNRGNIYFRLKKYAAALEDYDHTLRLDPENATALYNRGLTRHRLGDRAAACQDLQHALILGNQNAAHPLAKICDDQ